MIGTYERRNHLYRATIATDSAGWYTVLFRKMKLALQIFPKLHLYILAVFVVLALRLQALVTGVGLLA